MVILPTYALHHSEELFGKDHDDFNPDRYKGFDRLANDYAGSPDYEGRDHYGYGAGRRICPGIHLAERNMWRIAAKLLWAFEFSAPVDETTGKPIPLDTSLNAYTSGILIAPKKFRVTIKPRSEAHVAKIRRDKLQALEFMQQYDE